MTGNQYGEILCSSYYVLSYYIELLVKISRGTKLLVYSTARNSTIKQKCIVN